MYETNAIDPSRYLTQTARMDAPVDTSSRIRDGISMAEQLLSDLHDAISQLDKRLDVVLTPVPPQPTGGAGVAPKAANTSHVHGRLQILNEGHAAAVSRLRDLAQRIEV
jgi:hypothetical protein